MKKSMKKSMAKKANIDNMPPVNASKQPKGTVFGAPNTKMTRQLAKQLTSKGMSKNYR